MNDDFDRIMRESNENMSRMNNAQNAQQITNSISSAAAQINQGNENRAHERCVQELRMGMVNATTDRQQRALEVLLQEENERWNEVLRKRKRNKILGIVFFLIFTAITVVFVFYMIGRNSSSYETVHNDVGNQPTTPIQKSVTHSSSTEEAEITKDSKAKEITTNELDEVDTKNLNEEQAIEWVSKILEKENEGSALKIKYNFRTELKSDNLLYIMASVDQMDGHETFRINSEGYLEQLLDPTPNSDMSYKIVSQKYLEEQFVEDFIKNRHAIYAYRYNISSSSETNVPNSISNFEDAKNWVIENKNKWSDKDDITIIDVNINPQVTALHNDNLGNYYTVVLGTDDLNGTPSYMRGGFQFKVYENGRIDKRQGLTDMFSTVVEQR